jgi:hypothetical protein
VITPKNASRTIQGRRRSDLRRLDDNKSCIGRNLSTDSAADTGPPPEKFKEKTLQLSFDMLPLSV